MNNVSVEVLLFFTILLLLCIPYSILTFATIECDDIDVSCGGVVVVGVRFNINKKNQRFTSRLCIFIIIEKKKLKT